MKNKISILDIKEELKKIEPEILDAHPILRYRIENIINDVDVRGMIDTDSKKCAIVLDDSIIGGRFHYPCVIYMREGGEHIGEVGPNMREERLKWSDNHNTYEDPICRKNCLDVCRDHNNKYRDTHQ